MRAKSVLALWVVASLIIWESVALASDVEGTKEPGAEIASFPTSNTGEAVNPQTGEMAEEEKLYRYFGVASEFSDEGRYEEAIEILRYILEKKPEDDYVRSYLRGVTREMKLEKTRWKKKSKEDAKRLKRKRVQNLIQDGIDYYKAEDYDRALVKFSDALSLDAHNGTAKRYMKRLENHYLREVEIENLTHAHKKDITPFMDKETKEQPEVKDLIESVEMQYIALNKKADSLLDQTELGYRVEEIVISEKKKEERTRKMTMGPGDVVQISVIDHPELSGQVSVRLNGEVVLPLVNDQVIAKGLTLEEFRKKVIETMKRYVQNPRVNVSAIEFKSKSYYVIDEVGSTPYPITRADFSLRDALFTSDWGDNRALGRVIVMKPSKRKPIIKKVDAFDLVYRGKLEDDVRIEDGDVIYIPMTFAAKTTKTVQDLLGPFRAIRQARDNYLNLKWNEKDWRDITVLPINYDGESEDGKDVRLENISLRDYIISR